jgi:nucleoside-diphosphate-sugar epimerase
MKRLHRSFKCPIIDLHRALSAVRPEYCGLVSFQNSFSRGGADPYLASVLSNTQAAEVVMDEGCVLILGAGGYIGSALAAYLRGRGFAVTGIDNGLRNGPGTGPQPPRSFRSLTPDELAPFGGIVLLAGHSSVAACEREPQAAFANNVTAFVELLPKLRGQKLLFASSISIYVRTPAGPASERLPLPPPVSHYDLHKQVIEQYARIAYPNYFALRLGTLCGPSPNIRLDLLLNSLVWSALNRGRIEVSNRGFHRPILGIHDFCRATETLLAGRAEPGPYNLASANVTIGAVVDYVAGRFGVPCVEVERPTHYDIEVCTDKFTSSTGMAFNDTVASLVEELAASLTPIVAHASR